MLARIPQQINYIIIDSESQQGTSEHTEAWSREDRTIPQGNQQEIQQSRRLKMDQLKNKIKRKLRRDEAQKQRENKQQIIVGGIGREIDREIGRQIDSPIDSPINSAMGNPIHIQNINLNPNLNPNMNPNLSPNLNPNLNPNECRLLDEIKRQVQKLRATKKSVCTMQALQQKIGNELKLIPQLTREDIRYQVMMISRYFDPAVSKKIEQLSKVCNQSIHRKCWGALVHPEPQCNRKGIQQKRKALLAREIIVID